MQQYLPYTTKSSLNHTFLLISSKQLVEHQHPPSDAVLDNMIEYARTQFIKNTLYKYHLEDEQILFDAEGEMLGFGGFMKIITFMFLNHKDTPGLVIDMTCERSVSLAQDILQCEHLKKIVWGAESDVSSLIHQRLPSPLNIVPCNMIDIQKIFTENEKFPLSMKKALAEIQKHEPERFSHLPEKDIIDWNEKYSKNREALPTPMSEMHIKYSVDDLHRIAIIIHTMQKGYNSIYRSTYEATTKTEHDILRIQQDIYGMMWFYKQIQSYKRAKRLNRPLVQQLAKAVVIQRHLIYLRTYYANALNMYLSPSDCRHIQMYETEFNTLLAKHNVIINNDLSFNRV